MSDIRHAIHSHVLANRETAAFGGLMELDNWVGKTVLLNVTQEFGVLNSVLIQSGPNSTLLYAKIVKVDECGVWVENPTWRCRSVREGEATTHRINLLVQWRFLISVATFPERKFPAGEPIVEENARMIGFGDRTPMATS